jgi:hypothetical protein
MRVGRARCRRVAGALQARCRRAAEMQPDWSGERDLARRQAGMVAVQVTADSRSAAARVAVAGLRGVARACRCGLRREH